jgi:hypothetical protein
VALGRRRGGKKCRAGRHFFPTPFAARLDWEVVPPDGADRAALAVAAGQRGVVTARQLGGCGLTRHDIARRVRSGWLRRRYRGVFVVGPVDAPHAAAMAAVLAVGDGALLSHEAAAVLRAMRVPRAARST